MLRRFLPCSTSRRLVSSSLIIQTHHQAFLFASTNKNTNINEDDIHWYTKIWKERALDGGSSRLKRLDNTSAQQHEEGTSSSSSSSLPSPDEVARSLRLLTQCQNELDLTHALPDILCAEMVEFYHQLSSASSSGGDNKNLLVENRIQFVLDLTSFAPLRKETLMKQLAKLNEYTNQLVKNEEETTSSKEETIKMQTRVSALVRSIHQTTEPLHEAWMKRVITLPAGTKVMIDFRSDLLAMKSYLQQQVKTSSSSSSSSTKLLAVETALESLTRILRRWFSTSWMLVEELTWQNTTAAVIEQVIRHEAVHRFIPSPAQREIPSLNSKYGAPMQLVKQRMKPSQNRSLFAFFHPHVPSEPIVMLQVAYTFGGQYASSVDRILDREVACSTVQNLHPVSVYKKNSSSEQQPDTAIFYSISSTQKGLAGIELGKHLIKRAVQQILVENNNNGSGRNISHFSTLSPIPGYSRWAMGNTQKVLFSDSTSSTSSNKNLVEDFVSAFYVSKENIPSSEAITTSVETIISVLENFIGRKIESAQEAVSLFWSVMNNFSSLIIIPNSNKKNSNSLPTFFASQISKEFSNSSETNSVEQIQERFLTTNSNNKDHTNYYCNNEIPTSVALWTLHEEFSSAVYKFLTPSVKHFLVDVKRRGRAFDPVAHFHLRNGADLFRINPLADCTVNGSANSCCFMVNYEYELEKIDERSLNYENSGEFVVKL